MSGPTKGPWHLGCCEGHTMEQAITDNLCCLSVRDENGARVPATAENLTMMAAAPQLVDACEDAAKLLMALNTGTGPGTVRDALELALCAAKEPQG